MNYFNWSDPDLGHAYELLNKVVDRLTGEFQDQAKRIRSAIQSLDEDLENL